MSEYTQVDLQIGTEAQFETKKATLPEGVLVGLTDPIHENELDSALQTKLNDKASTSYVQGNPTESGTVDLTKLKIGNTVYNVPQGGGETYEVVELTSSQTTLTDDQYNTLIASPFNKIKLSNKIYNLYQDATSELEYTTNYLNNGYRININKTTKNITKGSLGSLTTISSLVKNNLTYDKNNSVYALSAYQGKVLNDRLTALENASGGGGVTSVTTSGTGNAVTSASISGNELTLTKGSTFLTAHQSLDSCAKLSAANTFTGANDFKARVTFSAGLATDAKNAIKVQDNYSISLPTKTGTVALTSDIPTIEANPTASGTTALTKLKVGSTVYTLPGEKPTIILQTSTGSQVTSHYGRIYYTFTVDSGIINDVSSGKYNVIIYDQTSGGGYYYCPLQGENMTFLGEEVPNGSTKPVSIVGWSFKAKESATTLSFWRDSLSLGSSSSTAGVSSLGGQTGAITLGDGLSMSNNQLVPKIKNIYLDSSDYLCIETNE